MTARQTKRIFLPAIFLILFVQLFTLEIVAAKEKEFPEKPIQLLVGYAPGALSDLQSRALAKVAPKYLEKPLIVANMPGAASTVSMNELTKSIPDGYTIAWTTTGYRSMTAHQQKVPFDPKALKFLIGFAEMRQLFFVKADSPYTKLEDLIAYGRKNPKAIKYGHTGRGLAPHINGLLFFKSVNVEAADVPYTGTAELVQAVIGGHIMVGATDTSGIRQLALAGMVKPVVIFTDERVKEFPDVPTSKEKGYTDLSGLNPIIGICIHRDTPPDRFKKLHDSLKKVVEDAEFNKMLDDMGLASRYFSPETMEDSTAKMAKIYVPMLKELKLFVH